MQDRSIKAKCRKCGKMMPADEYVLDPVYKMMVCSQCVKERKMKENRSRHETVIKENKKAVQDPKPKKPKDWDSEDDLLEKLHRQKQKSMIQDLAVARRIDDKRVQYRCVKCKYSFVYNVIKETPKSCPFCNEDIHKFRIE